MDRASTHEFETHTNFRAGTGRKWHSRRCRDSDRCMDVQPCGCRPLLPSSDRGRDCGFSMYLGSSHLGALRHAGPDLTERTGVSNIRMDRRISQPPPSTHRLDRRPRPPPTPVPSTHFTHAPILRYDPIKETFRETRDRSVSAKRRRHHLVTPVDAATLVSIIGSPGPGGHQDT